MTDYSEVRVDGIQEGSKEDSSKIAQIGGVIQSSVCSFLDCGSFSLPPWSLSHLEAIACHMAVDPLTGERQNISTLPWSLSHLEAVACHCVQGMAVDPLTRERQNIRTLLKGISFYSYFYQHAMSLPGLRCSTSCRMFFFMMSYVLRLLMFQSPPSNTAKTLDDMVLP